MGVRRLRTDKAPMLRVDRVFGFPVRPLCARPPRPQANPGRQRWAHRAGLSAFSLVKIHPQAENAAYASECSAEQRGNDAFWTFGDDVIANRRKLNLVYFERLAGELGVDEKYQACIVSGKYRGRVATDFKEARAHDWRGTPVTVVHGYGKQIAVRGALPAEACS